MKMQPQITSNANNLPGDNGPESPRIIMHVDVRAKKRHKAILNIAKSIRDISNNSPNHSKSWKKRFLTEAKGKRV